MPAITPTSVGFLVAYIVWSALMIVGLCALVNDVRVKFKSLLTPPAK